MSVVTESELTQSLPAEDDDIRYSSPIVERMAKDVARKDGSERGMKKAFDYDRESFKDKVSDRSFSGDKKSVAAENQDFRRPDGTTSSKDGYFKPATADRKASAPPPKK